LINNGLINVDTANYEIDLGESGDSLVLGGTGTFALSNGKLFVLNVTSMGSTNSLTWEISGGELLIHPDATGFDDANHASDFEVSGGDIAVTGSLCTSGDITWSGGEFDVSAGKKARFNYGTCP